VCVLSTLSLTRTYTHTQTQYEDIVKSVDELLDRQEELQNVIVNARTAIEQAKTRARPTGEKERELKGAQARLSVLLRSPAHRRGMARVTIAMFQLPELVLRSFCSRLPGHVLWSASCGLQLCFPYLTASIALCLQVPVSGPVLW
jgi:hypothetical protein